MKMLYSTYTATLDEVDVLLDEIFKSVSNCDQNDNEIVEPIPPNAELLNPTYNDFSSEIVDDFITSTNMDEQSSDASEMTFEETLNEPSQNFVIDDETRELMFEDALSLLNSYSDYGGEQLPEGQPEKVSENVQNPTEGESQVGLLSEIGYGQILDFTDLVNYEAMDPIQFDPLTEIMSVDNIVQLLITTYRNSIENNLENFN